MDYKIKGKTVLVSASSKGIGRATAELFLQEGCNVAVCSSNESNLRSAAKEMKEKFGVEPLWTVCNIDKPGDIENTVKVVNEKFGAVDILVNNCGGLIPGYFETLSDENWESAFDQVLMSVIRFTRLVLPGMKTKNWGRIINITSLAVKQPVDNLILSNSLRSAVTAFAKTLSNQVGKHNVTINNVAPGYTLTSRIDELAEVRAKQAGITKEDMLKSMSQEVPMKRMASPEEIASLIVYLASHHAGYVTGSTIGVDGGVVKATY
ncbi:MAG: SDR family oxidoreductase [Bacteroidetes bacterium]|nr:SDR family oxidoreductase [Bacteroidota bacterium]